MTPSRTGGPRVHVALVSQPVDVAALLGRVAGRGAGATALFLGTVRDSNEGRAVEAIDYHAYPAMAVRELRLIADAAAAQFGTEAVAIEHRTGHLTLGEVSVAIAASHARRQAAFEATRFAIDAIKQRVPIWKREHYVDGTREWVDPTGAGAHAGAAIEEVSL